MSVIDDTVNAPPELYPADLAAAHGAVLIARTIRHSIEPVEDVPDSEPVASPGSYPAVLAASAVFLPTLAMVLTLTLLFFVDRAYVTWLPVLGMSGAVAIWLVVCAFCRKLADAKHSIPSSHGELLPRLAELKASLKESRFEIEDTQDRGMWIAYDEAMKEASQIHRELETPGIRWLLAAGYGAVWGRLLHAEEAMIEIAPLSKVLQGADRDEARLHGSDIQKRAELLAMLRAARRILGGQPGDIDSLLPPVAGVESEQRARGALRYVRASLDEYRNARWNGLIQARNRLLATFTLTAMIIFLLLSIAIMAGAPQGAIIAASVFYVVGATIGLGNRLRSESQADSAIPDYGLSAARLITVPLFSGLGAIGGLVLAPLIGLSKQLSTLNQVFDLSTNYSGLLVAAIFGLTPGLLFERLQKQSEKYKADLKSSESTDGSSGDPATRLSNTASTTISIASGPTGSPPATQRRQRSAGAGRGVDRPSKEGERITPHDAAPRRGAARVARVPQQDGDHSARTVGPRRPRQSRRV